MALSHSDYHNLPAPCIPATSVLRTTLVARAIFLYTDRTVTLSSLNRLSNSLLIALPLSLAFINVHELDSSYTISSLPLPTLNSSVLSPSALTEHTINVMPHCLCLTLFPLLAMSTSTSYLYHRLAMLHVIF